jgi:hypothetical protein
MRTQQVIAITLLGLAACEQNEAHHPPAVATVTKRLLQDANLDLLVVVDNSPSTSDKQQLFVQNFKTLIDQLDNFPAGRPSLHLGVVSTTVGLNTDVSFGSSCSKTAPNDDGRFQHLARVPGCSSPADAFIIDALADNGGRTTNYSGTLHDAFGCIAELGSTGCGFEAPLEAIKRALDGSHPENAGFLRDDANLGIVILTDEDDCSVADPSLFALNNPGPGDFRCQPLYAYDCDQPIVATGPGTYTNCHPRHGSYLADPASYVDFLDMLKDPSQISVSLIAGDPTTTIQTGPITQPFTQSLALEPSCSTTIDGNLAIGRPAIRLDEFRKSFGDHGQWDTVCKSDYTGALQRAAGSIFDTFAPCLSPSVDATDMDATNPGIQPKCRVVDRQSFGTAGEVDAEIPPCVMYTDTMPAEVAPAQCWWVQPNASLCTNGGLEVQIRRTEPPPVGTVTDVVCDSH